MATKNPIRHLGENGAGRKWPAGVKSMLYNTLSSTVGGDELGFLPSGNKMYGDVPNRSGSAPPSIEGSLASLGNFAAQRNTNVVSNLHILSKEAEEQLCSDPQYLEYYSSRVNLNPRLPPPLMSKENRRLMLHIGKNRDRRMGLVDNSIEHSMFLHHSTLSTHKEESEDDRSPRLVADNDAPHICTQENCPSSSIVGFSKASSLLSYNISDPSNSSFEVGADVSCSEIPSLSNSSIIKKPANSNSDAKRTDGTPSSDINLPVFDSVNSRMKSLSINSNVSGNHQGNCQLQNTLLEESSSVLLGALEPASVDNFSQAHLKLPLVTVHSGFNSPSTMTQFLPPTSVGSAIYQNLQQPTFMPPQFGVNGYALNASFVPPVIAAGYSSHSSILMPPDGSLSSNFNVRPYNYNFPSSGSLNAGVDFVQQPHKYYEQLGVVTTSVPNTSYARFLPHPGVVSYINENPYNAAATPQATVHGNHPDSLDQQKLPSTFHLTDQRFQSSRGGNAPPNARKGGIPVPNCYRNNPYPVSQLSYPAPQIYGSALPGTYSPGRRNENFKFQGSSRSMGASSGVHGMRGYEKFIDPGSCSLLDELMSNRARRFGLSDIAGHIVEFSADQHGSRFIQQKLENCSFEEKASVFKEILPHASRLMTDVFGNYVIQKFFEYGSNEQRRGLGNELAGHVLALSMQMYGCRVIQKALEVIELDQKIQLVYELDGHVMRCLYDQNGNHVIQKCIERIPVEHISFIISAFSGQVAKLSMHPYGCRVVQRVLEHCDNDPQGECVIIEILQSACVLAQDQYGNYVTQHVLEKRKPHERNKIITQLAGQVVQMSQNKYASNVIEKCFQYGNTAERKLLIKEIIEQTEGNDYLLMMMKDQFANYVVQKILETCNDGERETLLGRIRNHLPALRKYTYGKHIVSRVEQLCGGTDVGESIA